MPQGWTTIVGLLDAEIVEEDPLAGVQRLCALCVDATGTSGASLVISSNAHRSTVWATDWTADRLEELQLTFSEGPVIDALRRGRPVLVPKVSAEPLDDWPWFAPSAVQAGARAMFVCPVQVGKARIGALSVYRSVAGEMSRAEQAAFSVCAEGAALLLTVDRGEQDPEASWWALDDRTRFAPQVHWAVGALRAQLGLQEQDAFARLCAQAFLTGMPIGQVAEEIVAGRLLLDRDDRDGP